jgi:hypothetical protein
VNISIVVAVADEDRRDGLVLLGQIQRYLPNNCLEKMEGSVFFFCAKSLSSSSLQPPP